MTAAGTPWPISPEQAVAVVDCEVCRAPVGSYCRSMESGKIIPPHVERYRAAVAKLEAEGTVPKEKPAVRTVEDEIERAAEYLDFVHDVFDNPQLSHDKVGAALDAAMAHFRAAEVKFLIATANQARTR